MKNLITVSALLLGSQVTAFSQEQPNIVMLFVDDLGWADLGYNNPVFDTPNINKLKSDGLYFSRAYVASATSSPSRASLLTGKESLRCGFVRHIYGKDTSLEFETFDKDPGKMKSRAYLPLEEITYAERLKEFGYYNMFVGKWHLGTEPYFPTKQGFDAMYGTCEHGHPNNYYQPFFKTNNPFPKARKNTYLTNLIGDGAVDFINKYDKKTPFLLNVWYYGVHGPQIGRKDLVAKYEKKGLTGKYAQYAAMIEALDETVGEIRSSLEKKGIADNTVIIFSSDQGGAFKNGANSSQDDDQTGMGTGQYSSQSVGEADELQAIMDDYNKMFGTAFTTENFRAYYDDINLRMKKKKADMKPLDLCLVVGMFLTGFDSKKLNTLYVDKNMEYHGLLQAFSRTNRVLNEKKRFGKIICFRDLKNNVDTSIKLFSNSDNPEDIVRPPFEEVKQEYITLATEFLQKYPTPGSIDYLQSENDKKNFVLAFRDIIRKHAEIQIYEDYSEDADDLGLTEQQFNDYKSKYLDITVGFINPPVTSPVVAEDPVPYGNNQGLEDIDFCLELLHSDIINVAYILELIADLDPYSDDYSAKRQHIIDTMIKDAGMRGKAKLIDGFIQKNVDEDKENFMTGRNKADGTNELEERLNQYIVSERNKAICDLANEEQISADVLNHYIKEYDYLQKEQPEIIQKALKEKHLGLIKTRKALTRIMDGLRSIIRTFSWD